MKKYAILLGIFDKQISLIERLYHEIKAQDVTIYENKYVFALKSQQFYTAIEDLLKQIAKSFENHIEDLTKYHKELLIRLNTDIPNIRPAALSTKSFLFLDKLRAFRHFIRHAYDVELDESELKKIQHVVNSEFPQLLSDLDKFRKYVIELSSD